MNRRYKLTDYGMIFCNALRNHKASGGSFGNFTFKPLALHDVCDECGRTIPDTPGGGLANCHHAESCSLYERNEQ